MTPILCTSYLPSVAYMAHLAQHTQVEIEVCETYPKQTLRNRAVIATAGGAMRLTVPVSRPHGARTTTGDVRVCYGEPWPMRHIRAIEAAYRAAPFFLHYWDDLRAILAHTHERLVDLNEQLLRTLLRQLKLPCETRPTTQFLPPSDLPCDLRASLSRTPPPSGMPFPTYYQVFADRIGFQPNLCVLDLLFCMGPEAHDYLLHLSAATPTKSVSTPH